MNLQHAQAKCGDAPAGALPLYESMAILGDFSAEQQSEEGSASDAEEPPQLATVLEQVRLCEAARI